MGTDPAWMAAALQGTMGTDVTPAPDWDSPTGRYIRGVGSGLYKQYAQPIREAGQSALNTIEHPLQAETQAGEQFAALPATIAHGASSAWNAVTHPRDTITNTLNSLESQASTPEGAGELTSRFIPGPGELANLARATRTMDIWGGPKSPMYKPELAQKAQEMKAAGATDREIYDATFDPAAGGGYWNAPQEWGQEKPWFWVSDQEANLRPGAMAKIRAEGKRQLADAQERINARLPFFNGQYWSRLSPGMTQSLQSALKDTKPEELRGAPADIRSFLSDERNVPSQPFTMEDLMSPKWRGFQAYPGLRDQPVHVKPWTGFQGAFVPGKSAGEVHGLPDASAAIGDIYGNAHSEKNVLDTLLHEVGSHSVQDFERMPQGGAPGQIPFWEKQTEGVLRNPEMYTPKLTLSDPEMELAQRMANRVALARTPPPHQAGMPPELQGYLNIAGEANARLPMNVLQAERYEQRNPSRYVLGEARQEPQRIYPFERYEATGTSVGPRSMLVRGQIPHLSPHLPLYSPGAPESLENVITGQLPEPIAGRDISKLSRPEQLSLGLRRARKK